MDSSLRKSLIGVACSGAALSAGALLALGVRAGISVAVGAAIATGNLWLLARLARAFLEAREDPADGASSGARPGVWVFAGLLKTGGLLALVWLILRSEIVAPLAMLVGFGALPMGIAIGPLVSDRRPRPEK